MSDDEVVCLTLSEGRMSNGGGMRTECIQKTENSTIIVYDSDFEELMDIDIENQITTDNGNNKSLGSATFSEDSSLDKTKRQKKKRKIQDMEDFHNASTDEIDSDEICGFGKVTDPLPRNISCDVNFNLPCEPVPCCSKSLLQPPPKDDRLEKHKLPYLSDSDSDLPELPDIDIDVPSWCPVTVSGASTATLSEDDLYSSQSTVSSLTSQRRFQVTKPKTSKAEKEKQKELRRLEKEKKMEEKKRAHELRKATAEVQKSSKPGESVKHMIVMLPDSLIQKFDGIVAFLASVEIKYQVVEEPVVENSITFKRELLQQGMDDNLKVQLTSKIIDEDQVMVFLNSDKIIPMIHAQLYRDSDTASAELDLVSWVESIKSVFGDKKLTLLIYDLDRYFRKLKKTTQQDFRNRVLKAGGEGKAAVHQTQRRKKIQELPEMTMMEVQSGLIQMQLQTCVNYRMIKNFNALGSMLVQYTKAIADAPFKKQRLESQGFDWFALSDSTGSVKIEKDGAGLKKLWIEQLQQFSGVGADMAAGLARRYPSPLQLFKAFTDCPNQDDGEKMLQDFSVSVGVGPLARTKRLGPEASKKMYRFFTSTNGDRFLGATLDSR